MRWRVQLGIKSTSDVCKFCQIGRDAGASFIISMTKLHLSTKYQPQRETLKRFIQLL